MHILILVTKKIYIKSYLLFNYNHWASCENHEEGYKQIKRLFCDARSRQRSQVCRWRCVTSIIKNAFLNLVNLSTNILQIFSNFLEQKRKLHEPTQYIQYNIGEGIHFLPLLLTGETNCNKDYNILPSN